MEPLVTNEYTMRDTFHFVSMLNNKDHHLIMASLDVDSLFTNIPLNETIDIVTDKVFENKQKVNGILKVDFRKLLTLATKGSVFFFNGSYYRQSDGIPFGARLSQCIFGSMIAHYPLCASFTLVT